MKHGLKNKILDRLKEFEGKWIHKERVAERAKEWGYMSTTGIRRVQELAEDGIIERKEEGGTAYYRYEKTNPKVSQKETLDINSQDNQTALW